MATTKATLLGHRSATSFADLTLSGDLTVNGTTTTLDTAVQNVDKLEIGASSTDYGAKINQASTGNILQLQDNGTDVMVVEDGGNVTVNKAGSATDSVMRVSNALESSSGINSHGFSATFLNTLNNANAHGVAIGSKHADSNSLIVGQHDTTFDHFVVKGDGKVGIGDTSPSYKLTVDAGTVQDTACKIIQYGGYAGFIVEGDATNTGTAIIRIAGTGTGDSTLQFTAGGSNRWNVSVDNSEANDPLKFYDYASSSTVMTLANGKVGIGAPSDGNKLEVHGIGNESAWITLNCGAANYNSGLLLKEGGGVKWFFYNDGGSDNIRISDSADNDGVKMAQNANGWTAITSDERMKKDWVNFEDALTKINTLTKIGEYRRIDPVTGEYLYEDANINCRGLSAQEVKKIIPKAVNKSRRNFEFHPEDDTEYYSLNYQDVFVLGLKAIQELSAKVTALENAIN